MKKKLSDFWYYHKWYILFVLLVLWVAVDFLSQKAQNVEPDATISFVTMAEVPAGTLESLEKLAGETVGDVNGDGRVEAVVNVYAYNAEGPDGTDTEVYAASAVHLAAEIRLELTDFFVTDQDEVFQENDTLERLGVWGDYACLAALEDTYLLDYAVYTFAGGDQTLLNALK